MSGLEFRSHAPALAVGKATAFLGGVDLDLRGAGIVDGAMLELRAVLGGISVTVPGGWRVEVRQSAVAGEVVNATEPDEAPDDAPVLVIDAVAWFGGIAIGVEEQAAVES
jgi:hypothetical protein